MKLHIANPIILTGLKPGHTPGGEHRFEGVCQVILEGPWCVVIDQAGDEVFATSEPCRIVLGKQAR